MEKPPLGIIPKTMYQAQRLEDIKEAVKRYFNHTVTEPLEIPIAWIEEYNEIMKEWKQKDKSQ